MSLRTGLVAVLALGALAGLSHAGSPMHPDVPLLDAAGDRVLETGRPVSPVRTCGQCHDAEFIEAHDFHASVGWHVPTGNIDTRILGGTTFSF